MAVFFALFFFVCFLIAVNLSKKRLKKLVALIEVEKESIQRLAKANSMLDNANLTFEEAKQIRINAEKQVESVQAENKVFHSAIEEVVNLWINDSWKSIVDKLSASNHATQKARMEKVFETCRKYGLEFDGRQERAFYVRLESEWKREVADERAREEQARIKEIMREEQRAEKVRAAELKKLEEERKELEAKHSEHLDRIKMLKELETLRSITEEQKRELDAVLTENSQLELEIAERVRRQSMAELTRAGNVYVISNIGSFGEMVFKVGMTRRLIPEERVKELSDASVPFPFDCHMMIPTEDAPTLEYKLHEALWKHRMNKVNDGKEFFRIDLDSIKQLVDKHCKDAVYSFVPNPSAAQWRESELRRNQNDSGEFSRKSKYVGEKEEAA